MPCTSDAVLPNPTTTTTTTTTSLLYDSPPVVPPRRIRFRVNGVIQSVGPEVPPWTLLVDYLREQVKLSGTKVLCREGGCGVCTVVATVPNAEGQDPPFRTFSINACQTLVYSCGGWTLETIEHLGNRYKNYHSLQKALDGFYGTQCGYCSPGMIMTMYGQLKSSGNLTVSQVESSLDGNLCRCTGYRPILDAFKSLAQDGSQCLKDKLADIEDAYKARCPKTGDACKGSCGGDKIDTDTSGKCDAAKILEEPLSQEDEELMLSAAGVQWYQPLTIQGVLNILKKTGPDDNLRIVVGNTGQGVYKYDGPFNMYINSSGVQELNQVETGPTALILGANVSLTRCIQIFNTAATTIPGYQHLTHIAQHWGNLANVGIRNVGSWAGNLMLKHKHREFPSDVFLTLLVCNARLLLRSADEPSNSQDVPVEDFLATDMSKTIIQSISLPPMDANVQIRSFKISPRAANAHAYVNAGMKMKLDVTDGFKVVEKPIIVFGGINPQFVHAEQTESYLTGKHLTDDASVKQAAIILGGELQPDSQPQDASPQYRKALAQGLLFKTVLSLVGDSAGGEVRSGGNILERGISSGHQDFDMNQDSWPVGKGIPKLASAVQISGEAVYMDDMVTLPNEAHGVFVLSEYANAKIKSVNATEALSMAGVLTFVKAGDIPGTNTYVVNAGPRPDPVFATERVSYAGQAIGMVVADRRDTAVRAARLVQVEYEDIQIPVLTIDEALKHPERKELPRNMLTGKQEPYTFGDADGGLRDSKHKLSGSLYQGSQFHLAMEPLSARVVPVEDGYDVFSTTQWPTETQAVVATVLQVPAHSINITVRRLGGGYGGKISRQNVVAAAAAVAAKKLEQPVRVVLDLNTNMALAGWREPFLSKYEVGFEDDGKVSSLKVDVISDTGHVTNEASVNYLSSKIQNCYYIPNLLYRPITVNTDTAANTWCRTPGTVEVVATIENILEHIAVYLGHDPQVVRENNMVPPEVKRFMAPPHTRNVVAQDIMPLLLQKAMVPQRKQEIAIFNSENRWKKKGLSVVPLWYGLDYPGMFRYGGMVVIYEHDGTVAITHGGIEMGQGINVKVAQVVAHTLGVPMELVMVKASDTVASGNSTVTGGSFASDLCAHGVRVACGSLRERLDVIRTQMMEGGEDAPTWIQLVKKSHAQDVDLSERFWTAGKNHPASYDIWAACCLEVEVDILTGQYLIHRADIVEDCGRSLNPYVDVGQVEGALIMGLGFYTSEMVKFDPTTGQKISNGTWEYKPPTALDIPVDMRITFLPNTTNPHGVLGSKSTGEPALCLSYVVVTALRNAITAFRTENGNTDWFEMNTPLTPEKVHELCGVTTDQFVLHPQRSSSASKTDGEFCLISKEHVVPAEAENSGVCPLS